jgi:hypothetical protein
MRRTITALMFASILWPRPIIAQQALTASQVDSIVWARTAAAFAYQEDVARSGRRRLADSLYVVSLERSVQRAAVDGTWVGVYIGALGGLFAIGAIVAGFLLFRESREYRAQLANQAEEHDRRLDEKLAQYQVLVNALIAEAKEEVARSIVRLETDREALKQRGAVESEEAKRRIDAELERLEARYAKLQPVQTFPPVQSPASLNYVLGAIDLAQLGNARSNYLSNTLAELFAADPTMIANGRTVKRVDIEGSRATLIVRRNNVTEYQEFTLPRNASLMSPDDLGLIVGPVAQRYLESHP